MKPLPKQMAEKVLLASVLFNERGLDGIKMSDIAEVTGIPKATLYYYFEGKQDVFSFIFTMVHETDVAAMTAAMEEPGTARERLSGVLRAYLEAYAANPVAILAVNLDLGRAAGGLDLLRVAHLAYVRPIRILLEEGLRDGSLPNVRNTQAIAGAILGAFKFGSMEKHEEVSYLHETLMRFILGGIG
jgi:TetR/AcrR family transcriptional regulator